MKVRMDAKRPTWLDLMAHLLGGGRAVAYFCADRPTEVAFVEFGREELAGNNRATLLGDAMFDVERPGPGLMGQVRVSEFGRAFWEGATWEEVRERIEGLGQYDRERWVKRRRQLALKEVAA